MTSGTAAGGEEREYWIADGDDLAKATAFIKERANAFNEMTAIGKKYGGTPVQNGRRIVGLAMSSPPDGWVKKGSCEGKPFYMPKRTSKALRAIYADLQSVTAKGADSFHSLLCGGDGGKMVDPGENAKNYSFRILYSTWEWVGDTLLLSIPTGSKFKPNGSRKLLMSEYWRMKESIDKTGASS